MDRQTQIGLLLCSLLRADTTCDADLEQLSDADWDEVLRRAARHGVMPLLYQHMRRCGPKAAVPAHVEQMLRVEYYRSAARNTQLYHSLLKTLRALQSAGIPVIVLKGVHLAAVVYGNIALRLMGDADLLVSKTDLARAEEKLRDLGYRPSRPFRIETICATSQHLPPFTQPDAPTIELHCNIVRPGDPFSIDLDGLWQRAQPASMDNATVLTLSPEDLLLHLCLHAAFLHRFAIGLRAVYDIAAAIQYHRDVLDWEQVIIRASRWGATKPAYLTLFLARESVGAGVPVEVLDALEPADFDPDFVAWAREQLLTRPGGSLPLSANLVRILNADGLQGKLANFLKFTFPSRAAMAAMYQVCPASKRIYLYYPVRLVDVLRRYGRTAWRLLRRDEAALAAARREDRGNALVDWLASP